MADPFADFDPLPAETKSAPAGDPFADFPVGDEKPYSPVKAAPAEPELGRSAVAGVRDAAVSVPGIVGSAGKAVDYVRDRLLTGALNGWQSLAPEGMQIRDPRGKALSRDDINAMIRSKAGMSESEAAGKTNRVLGVEVPTAEGALDMGKSVPGAYEPKTEAGQRVKRTTGLASALALGPGNLVQKGLGVVGGEGLGTVGEWATKNMPDSVARSGEFFGVTPEEARSSGRGIGTAVGLGLGAATGAPFDRGFIPDRSQQGLVGNTLGRAYDAVAGPSRADKMLAKGAAKDAAFADQYPNLAPALSPEEAAAATARGMPVDPVVAAGPNVRKIIGNAASDPTGEALVNGINDRLAGARQAPGSTMAARVDAAMGDTVNAGRSALELYNKMRDVNGANYKATMALPHAQAVWTPDLANLLKRADPANIAAAQELARIEGKPGLIAPVWQEPIPAVPHKILHQNGQWVETPGSPAVPGQWVPGPAGAPNLEFWDYLKKAMDDDIGNKTPVTNRESNLVRATRDLKNEMVGHVDKAVPEYAGTRGVAADMFGERDALQQGAGFFKNIDSFKRGQVEKAVESMPPNHREGFAIGFAQALKDGFESNYAATAKRVLTDQRFQAKMRLAMPNRAEAIIADTKAQAAMLKARPLDATGTPPTGILRSILHNTPASAMGAGAAHLGAHLAYGTPLIGATGVVGGLASGAVGAAGAGLGYLRSRQIRAANQEILRRAQDPARAADFGRRSAAPAAPARSGPPSIDQRIEPPPLTIHRKTGGRVKTDIGRAADRLIMMAEQAKAGHATQTQSMLQSPDEHVVRALHLANKAS